MTSAMTAAIARPPGLFMKGADAIVEMIEPLAKAQQRNKERPRKRDQ
jgi:hypothetical protein